MFFRTFCLLFLGASLSAQEFTEYRYLESRGPIPAGFLTPFHQRYQQALSRLEDNAPRQTMQRKKDFYLKSNYALSELLESGRVVFGDPVSIYVDKVSEKLLVTLPDLRERVQVLVLKSSSVNAYCTGDGFIFVTIGLMARLRTEAELAFVLSHEIAHYKDEHALNSYIDDIDLKKGRGRYSGIPFDDRIDLMFMNSRETELKADSAGLMIFLKTGYDTSAITSLLDVLHYDYLPFEEIPFDKSYFDHENFRIPSGFFLDSVKSISRIEDYKDENQTHPNILKRKQQVHRLLTGKIPAGNSDFQVSEEEFQKSKELARYEQIRLDLIRKNYGDAIYNAWILLQSHQGDLYLETSIAKGLYGMSKYKNIDEFQKVAKSYIRVEGESQQVHSMVRKLTKKQLNALALSYVRRLLQKYPENRMLDLINRDLILEMAGMNKTTLTDFKAFISSRKPVTGNDFIYGLFSAEELEDPSIQATFRLGSERADSLKRIEKMTLKEREALEKGKTRVQWVDTAVLVMIDPYVDFSSLENESDFTSWKNEEKRLMIAVQQYLSSLHRPVKVLQSSQFSTTETENYNTLCLYKELLTDISSTDRRIQLIPLGFPEKLIPSSGTVISQVAVIHSSSKTQLYQILFDLSGMKQLYTGWTPLNPGYNEITLQKIFRESISPENN